MKPVTIDQTRSGTWILMLGALAAPLAACSTAPEAKNDPDPTTDERIDPDGDDAPSVDDDDPNDREDSDAARASARAGQRAAAPTDDDEAELDGVPEHIGQFVRFELVTPAPDVAASFYSALFGWDMRPADDDDNAVYAIENRGGFLGRIRPLDPKRKLPEGWVSWLSVANVNEATRSIESNGGKIAEPPRRVLDEQRALLKGPTGGTFGVVQAQPGFTAASTRQVGNWYWNQLWTHNYATALSFYTLIGGYTAVEHRYENLKYWVLKSDTTPRAVIMTAPEGQKSRWLPFVRVADVDATVKSAQALKAKVVTPPRTVDGIGRMAVLRSPAGGLFGVIAPVVPGRASRSSHDVDTYLSTWRR